MTIRHHINRCRFVGTATTAIGGLLLPGTHLIGGNEKSIRANFQSNAHFMYRKPPDSPYIDSQRGNKAFSFSDTSIFLSEDNSNTWPHSTTFPDATNITFSHIFENYESANMIIQDGVILAAHYGPIASPFTLGFIISPDMGKTWAEYDLKEFGPRSPSRFHKKNAEGWFRVDLRTSWIDRAEVLFIKPR